MLNLMNVPCHVGTIFSHVDWLHVACRFEETAMSPCRIQGSRAPDEPPQSLSIRVNYISRGAGEDREPVRGIQLVVEIGWVGLSVRKVTG